MWYVLAFLGPHRKCAPSVYREIEDSCCKEGQLKTPLTALAAIFQVWFPPGPQAWEGLGLSLTQLLVTAGGISTLERPFFSFVMKETFLWLSRRGTEPPQRCSRTALWPGRRRPRLSLPWPWVGHCAPLWLFLGALQVVLSWALLSVPREQTGC